MSLNYLSAQRSPHRLRGRGQYAHGRDPDRHFYGIAPPRGVCADALTDSPGGHTVAVWTCRICGFAADSLRDTAEHLPCSAEPTPTRLVRFREQRARIEDSLKTLVELQDRAALIDHCRRLIAPDRTPASPVAYSLVPYALAPDPETGWAYTYLVVVYGYGPIGYTDALV